MSECAGADQQDPTGAVEPVADYEPPTLSVIGTLADLTQTGTTTFGGSISS